MNAKKILVADDSLTIQKVIRLALSGDGYEIQTVSDGKEALEQASLFRPEIIIVDVSLPVFDAYQVREQLLNKPDLKNIPVILMSSAFEKVDENRSRQLGFSGHLIKPFDPSHLRSTLLSVSNTAPANDPVLETINTPFHEPIQHNDPLGLNLPPLHTGAKSAATEDDIMNITKSTFEMTGLDQQEWGMFEPARIDETASPTFHPEMAAGAEVSAFDMDPISPEDDIQFTQGYEDHAGAQSMPHQYTISSNELEAMIKIEVAKVLDEMQSSIRERLQQEIFLFNQQQLPVLAEKLLKEEIHKLLSEPPV